MSETQRLEKQEQETKRLLELRELQMRSAALAHDAGEIDAAQLSEYAVRYAAAVREWMAIKHYKLFQTTALAETARGETWVHQ